MTDDPKPVPLLNAAEVDAEFCNLLDHFAQAYGPPLPKLRLVVDNDWDPAVLADHRMHNGG